ncbi:MAG TPA: outer membrane beta-barrel protein [Bryobacteraceae bacterium]|nr:outer membrane beta-barrel protein [Bryobacteraceae bacterium]
MSKCETEFSYRYRYFHVATWIIALVFASGLVKLNAEEMGDDTAEFSALAGVAAGGLGTHATAGGSAGISLSRYTMVLLETSVIPLGSNTLLPAGPVRVSGSDLFDFNFAIHVRIPVRRWEPYVLLGTGLLVNSYLAGVEDPSGTVVYQGHRQSKFGLEGGAGVRFYVRHRWGVRAEYRYTSSSRNFSRVLAGVFYQLPGGSLFHLRQTLRQQRNRR